MEKKCKFCGNTFEAKRSTAQYCSGSHKVMAFNSLKKGFEKAHNLLVTKSDNEVLGDSVADFCNKNNCTWDDVSKAYLESLKPIKPKVEPKKSQPSFGGGYNRRASKLGF